MTSGAGNSWEEIKEVPVAVEEVTVEGGGHKLEGIEILVAGEDDRVAADGHEVEGERLHMSPTGLSQLDYRLCPSHCSFWFNDHTQAATHSDVPTSVTRWVRQHRPNHQVHSHSKIDTTLTQTTRYGILSSLFNEVSYYASHVNLDFKEAREVAIQFMWRLKKRRAMTKEDNPNSVQRNRKTKLFGIGDPNIVKTKGCKRKSTGLVMTHRVKRQLYTNHERTDLTNGAIQSRHDINRATASRDAQVCQNGSFTISEASKRKAYNEFGFEQMNGLLVPCSVDAFQEVVSAVEFSHGRFDLGKFVEEFI
ncbi:hypothetical protein RHMOL_Rhmol06G0073000 [Rhododendron molle]|uniref:Uncharacterized protein n=2 Tax=Rhododendron molle TaxID=49168 RepID=A0ACC0NAC0_RHOML|nr:hypothetical protein RHMOL_Rhmol06G0073000 [Rhododendron molle]KAI8550035.1 hypothetical protein RHMOL_Rhmol06G0073000 [Rhododendron molle]